MLSRDKRSVALYTVIGLAVAGLMWWAAVSGMDLLLGFVPRERGVETGRLSLREGKNGSGYIMLEAPAVVAYETWTIHWLTPDGAPDNNPDHARVEVRGQRYRLVREEDGDGR